MNNENELSPTEVHSLLSSLREEVSAIQDEQQQALEMKALEDFAANYDGEDRVVSSHDLAELMKTRPAIELFPSGIKDLDEIIGGFVKKQLIVIAAPTKMGKTSFCIDLTSRLKDLSPLWFPFEEPAEELIQKFLDRNEMPPLFYTPEKIIGSTLKWIEKKIIEAKVKYNSQMVFIDHLHFIVPFSADRQDLLIGSVMRSLKAMAKRLNVVIFLIAHLKKTKMDRNPDLEDLRDSSFIAQEADTVMMLWRKTSRENGDVIITNEVNVSIQANRRSGKTGNVKLFFEHGRFIPLAEKQDEEFKDFTERSHEAWG